MRDASLHKELADLHRDLQMLITTSEFGLTVLIESLQAVKFHLERISRRQEAIMKKLIVSEYD
jgi:hypothetical protein